MWGRRPQAPAKGDLSLWNLKDVKREFYHIYNYLNSVFLQDRVSILR
jgi:hypothetical protein